MLKRKLKTLTGVSRRYHGLYKREGEFYVLRDDIDPETGKPIAEDEVDDDDDAADDRDMDREDDDALEKKKGALSAAERARVKEFRNENIKLRRELEAMKGMLGDLTKEDLDAMRESANRMKSEEEKALIQKGRLDEVMERRVKALQAEHEKKLKALTDELTGLKTGSEKLRRELKKDRIVSRVREEADRLKLKFPATAMEDINARALSMFDLDEEGNLISMDGEDPRVNSEGKEYSPKDFVMGLVESAPHLVEGASGGDFNGTGKRGNGGRRGVITIDARDPKAFGDNLEAIASGKMDVRIGG